MQIVVGLNLNNLQPKFWDSDSPYYIPNATAVMVSFAEFYNTRSRLNKAMEMGLHNYLGIPEKLSIYLDNGSFSFLRKNGNVPQKEYEEFVRKAQPDWYPIPQDFIPAPSMNDQEQLECLHKTMDMNLAYKRDGFVPVVHISRHLNEYLNQFQSSVHLMNKSKVALGGIVPNLLRMSKAMPYEKVIDSVRRVRLILSDKSLHVFGIGGTATLHLAALLDIDSVDSTGWRNRAARGIIQLPGKGDRIVAELGNWRGRRINTEEWDILEASPICQKLGIKSLLARGIEGFCARAAHNLWTLFNEIEEIEIHLANDTYSLWYESHLENSTYLRFIKKALLYRQKECGNERHHGNQLK